MEPRVVDGAPMLFNVERKNVIPSYATLVRATGTTNLRVAWSTIPQATSL